jgi:hypothetical protein
MAEDRSSLKNNLTKPSRNGAVAEIFGDMTFDF